MMGDNVSLLKSRRQWQILLLSPLAVRGLAAQEMHGGQQDICS